MRTSCSTSRATLCLLALFLVPVVGAWAVSPGDLVINEIDYDQPSTDTAEFLEIKNTTGAAINLGTLSVLLINGTGGGASPYNTIPLPMVNLAAGDYFVVCANAATVANCDLDVNPDSNLIQNGAPDAVALVEGAVIIDTVSYEGDTGAPYTEGSGAGLEDNPSLADHGISRCPDGVDTNQNNADLSLQPITPGAANSCPAPVLVINEIDYDQPGTDAAEFVEIKNVGAAAGSLSGFTLQFINGASGGAAVYDTIPLPAVTLAPGDYFVVCANAATVANCDLDDGPDTNFIQNGAPDAVALLQGALIVDTVSYEGDTVAPYTEGSGAGLEDNPSLADHGISRCPDGVDTNQNNVDFSFRPITPGAENDCPVPPPTLVINEIDYDQPGTDVAEFIEIKNTGPTAVNLAGFSLELVNGSGGGAVVYNSIALPAVSLAAGDYFVVCGNAANTPNCDLDVSPDTNLIQNGAPDAVALVQGATIVDTVSYEGNTGAPYAEGSGAGLEDDPGQVDHGISRCPDGVDTDQNNADFSFAPITPGATNSCPAPKLVINEIDYDQPGFDTAEFIEIKNAGTAAASLGTFSLELVNGSGGGAAVYNTIALPAVSLAAGDYFVVCGNAATVANCDLDVSPDSNLIQNGAPDAVALLDGTTIVDTVSYEGNTGAPYTEVTGTSAADSNNAGDENKGLSRLPDGTDTDVNDADFAVACITPGLPNTPIDVGCGPLGPVLEIYQIQGSGAASPFDGLTVTTAANVVTCLAPNGFFMQTPTARTDGNVDTSDGIFVFTGGPPAVAVGDLVDVSGTVVEFFGLTEFTGGSIVTVVGAGTVPAHVQLDANVPSPAPAFPSCAIEYECYESMLVEVGDGFVAGANQEFGSDPFAEIHFTAAGARPFREPGIEFPGLVGLPVWDGNPEVFELDPDKLGLPNMNIPAGSLFTAKGVIGFEFNHYELWPNELAVSPAPLPVPVRSRDANEMTIGSLNLFRLFDDVDDPPSVSTTGAVRNDAVVSLAEYLRRRAKLAAYVVGVLDSPDVLAVQEAEKIEVLQALAADINALDPAVNYTAYLVEGNDVGTIDSGFLVRDRIQVSAVTQLGAAELFTFDTPPSALHDRPPLLLEGTCDGTFPIAVLNLHMRSLGGIDTTRVQQKRFEQAVSVAQMVQGLQGADPAVNLVVIGDFNAFEFTDGYVDLAGIIKGDFDPLDSLVCSFNTCVDLVDPDLNDQVLGIDAAERYSFIFRDTFNPVRSRGDSQVLDHAMTSSALETLVTGFEYGRGNADAAEELLERDGTEPDAGPNDLLLRSSDHDGLVLFLFKDEDLDGVPDGDDVCLGTEIPEGVPTRELRVNRFALVTGDGLFDTTSPAGKGPAASFTVGDTGGCSCEQIIEALGLGQGHRAFGCSLGAMRNWVRLVNP